MSRFDLSAWGSRHRGVDTLALPARVKVGDAMPVTATEAIARQMLFTLVDAHVGAFSLSSGGAVWVREHGFNASTACEGSA